MDSPEFDNIKAEKEDALWRYNMEKKLRFCLPFSGFFLALFFTSWITLIPNVVQVAGDLPIFVVLNIIILVVYVLSTQKQSDIYDECVGSRTPAVAEETTVENAVAVAETKRSLSPLKQQQPPSTTTTSLTLTVTKPKSVIISTDEVKQKEYRRTRSVLSGSGNQRPRRRRKFKRSETAMMGRELVVLRTEPPRKSFDEMSNEEFRLIVDSFIAERRKSLIQENCKWIVVKN
ncbi:hypothetical protein like AT5G66440 [Hibiscus trionum]|uniref:Transmembrane protein n=1 Tax=Hibiscus trionum TaxID=183268 RepID=A0A9W7J5G2_HIBTR|nr:hypothetical protein like AT5G66440 [Hibiscus trionum]